MGIEQGATWQEWITVLGTNKALLSDCGRYRYILSREWDTARPKLNWIMLNPSTADARMDDPTIRRCMSLAEGWGYGGIVVTNLFALRSPDPAVLFHDADPVGILNDSAIVTAALECKAHIAAWGIHGPLHARDLAVFKILTEHPLRLPIKCLALTKGGRPRHPLYYPSRNAFTGALNMPIPMENP